MTAVTPLCAEEKRIRLQYLNQSYRFCGLPTGRAEAQFRTPDYYR